MFWFALAMFECRPKATAYREVYGSRGNPRTCAKEGWRLSHHPGVVEYVAKLRNELRRLCGEPPLPVPDVGYWGHWGRWERARILKALYDGLPGPFDHARDSVREHEHD